AYFFRIPGSIIGGICGNILTILFYRLWFTPLEGYTLTIEALDIIATMIISLVVGMLSSKNFKNKKLIEQINREMNVRKQKEEELTYSLKEREILIKEIHHRTKNNLQIIQSLIRMQMRRNPENKNDLTLTKVTNRIRAIALVHEHLYLSKYLSRINLGDYIKKLIEQIITSYSIDSNVIDIRCNIEEIQIEISFASPIGMIINELLINSMEHGKVNNKRLRIDIAVTKSNDQITLRFIDNGIGISTDTPEKSISKMGFQIIDTLVTTQLNGEWDFSGKQGTVHVITFKINES
ncbi:MAG: sensor histidine kinase, partial [Ignavibacteriaceae bacterium]